MSPKFRHELLFSSPPFLQLWQGVHDFYGFQADGDDAEEDLQGVFGVLHSLGGPEVGVVHDAAVFVGGDGFPFGLRRGTVLVENFVNRLFGHAVGLAS